MKVTAFILLILATNLCHSQVIGSLGDKASTLSRMQNIKQSTCKVLVDNRESGTGFFISSEGILVTNWHVIFNKSTRIESTTGRILSAFSIVNSKNDTLIANIALDLQDEAVIQEAALWDYCLLKIDTKNKTPFLKIGSFSEAYEGAPIYTCGYPLELREPFVTVGLISSFFTQTHQTLKSIKREVAWLDLTTNKGNSGGPLILIGEKPEDDRVIGITSFIVTPNYGALENLNQYVQSMEKNGGIQIMGIDFLQYVRLINETANANSVGISGCISIEKVANRAKRYNK